MFNRRCWQWPRDVASWGVLVLRPPMRRAAGLSPEVTKRSSHQMHPRDPHHPKAAGSRRPSPPAPPESRGCRVPSARAKRVVFEDEVTPLGTPPGRVPPAKDGEKPGARSVSPRLVSQPRAVPDYMVKYPAIRSPRQREGYKGVFQDQLWEYTELLGEDPTFLEKQRRVEYLKEKLTHIKVRIQEYDRAARGSTGTHSMGR